MRLKNILNEMIFFKKMAACPSVLTDGKGYFRFDLQSLLFSNYPLPFRFSERI